MVLFGAVQTTMILYGLLRGERFTPRQTAGLLLALAGVLLLDEHLSLRLVLCSIAILGGIALVLHARKRERPARS